MTDNEKMTDAEWRQKYGLPRGRTADEIEREVNDLLEVAKAKIAAKDLSRGLEEMDKRIRRLEHAVTVHNERLSRIHNRLEDADRRCGQPSTITAADFAARVQRETVDLCEKRLRDHMGRQFWSKATMEGVITALRGED